MLRGTLRPYIPGFFGGVLSPPPYYNKLFTAANNTNQYKPI
ncbi:hypothetical protein DKAM_0659 [Desulfurococcus amylolyticus 1221n]|uniref:Uncharacterized protein n=1 Tax=Desulfurococcus amylolyticus (strain DSM 18924 / JCM 16383 / VKM B-2413 / 1221n) TaxID=490899 RepID=B8D4F4_DESA1|nr:hypothetical protein DKAM_0659 [Desulfurococcus amylolyticus 1221n]